MSQLLETDDKGRLNLGKRYAHAYFIMEEGDSGNIILEPAAIIPKRELWIHKNPKAKKMLEMGIEQAKQGLGKRNAIDLDKYDV
jgi:hypothetical protein